MQEGEELIAKSLQFPWESEGQEKQSCINFKKSKKNLVFFIEIF